MKRFIAWILLMMLAWPVRFAHAADTPFSAKALCPVMPGEPVKEKFYVDYEGRRIYLCCRTCVHAFKKNPHKYLKSLSEDQPA